MKRNFLPSDYASSQKSCVQGNLITDIDSSVAVSFQTMYSHQIAKIIGFPFGVGPCEYDPHCYRELS